MILDYFISDKQVTNVCKLWICFIVLPFFTHSLNAQKDSIEVERLYKNGIDSLRIKTKTSLSTLENALQLINDSILTKDNNNRYFLLKKALILDELSFYYRKDTEYVKSLKAIQESLKIKEDIEETYTLPKTYYIFGRLYQHKKDSIKAFQFYNKALFLSKEYGNNKDFVRALYYLSQYYLLYKDLEKGKMYGLRAFKYADSIGYDYGKSKALSSLSSYETKNKNYTKVISYANKNIEICEKINDRIGLQGAYKKLGYAYRKMGQLQKAVSYYKKSFEMVVDIRVDGLIANRSLALSNIYKDLGNQELAFKYYRAYKRQQITDMKVKSIKEFAELEAKYTYERQKVVDSIKLVEKQKIKESRLLQQASTKFWKITTIIAVIFGLIITTIIFLLRKRKEQLRLGELKNEMLQQEIHYKQKDISDFALNISRNRKWREELLSYVKKIKKSGSLKNDTNFKALEKAILESEVVDGTMISFQNKVDILNSAFYEKLLEEYPTLTKTEVKLCSFIRLNIDNNEIAILQNIAIESVYRSRSRLRKKMNLSPDEDLNAILNKF
ncbi:tetratricopeptide repeat protein [Aquimarina sp. 2201CG5-10]|uniref:tetratricopeptide repeat protein n=1 Tax=Aquimarina callyspongiae TaxID=3098150 RepID=UPI002AB55017|nr:tetratricopeptide repeat protein [Aquimarina sp. 2201CG5-10]MDY8134569.1 tetratricopeptide repeat protein [Aquimarina sp. 2201CG5-10]